MINKLLPAILVTVLLWGCAKKTDVAISDSSHVGTLSDADAVTRVASDKELLRQALVEASTRGTLGEGVAAAATDSVVAAKMRQALMGTSMMSGTSPSKAHTMAPHSTTTASKKDALDKANESLDKANQTVTKSGEVINKAQDVGKKAGDILNGRR